MKILIYKRTHVGDPDESRQFGNEGCMGRVRNFPFDVVIGVGGVSRQPTEQGIAGKINWIGRNPVKSKNPIDSRGPLVSFKPEDFRLFEQQGPLVFNESSLLAKKIYGNRARYVFRSLNAIEQQEAMRLVKEILDEGKYDHLSLDRRPSSNPARGKIRCTKRKCGTQKLRTCRKPKYKCHK